jgi:hypothetical protein
MVAGVTSKKIEDRRQCDERSDERGGRRGAARRFQVGLSVKVQFAIDGVKTVCRGHITAKSRRKKHWTVTFEGGDMTDCQEDYIAFEDEGFEDGDGAGTGGGGAGATEV